MTHQDAPRQRDGWQEEELDWEEREQQRYRDENRERENPPGGGRGYGRGYYGQGRRTRAEWANRSEWAGRGYGRGDYGQDYGRNQAEWDYRSDEARGRGYGRGDYGQDYERSGYSRNQGEWDYQSNESRGRGYGRGDYGQGYRRDEDWNDLSNRTQRERQGDYGRNQQEYEADEPVTWTYTEWWMVPGPFSGRGPQGWQRSNERIREDICERLTQYGQLDASNVEVAVDNGEVTLSGTVNDRRGKRRAEDIVESVPGVRDVHNQIRVQESDRPGR
jgi:osmotically-inducible protein OsmY